jgi:hypothetical protein
MIKARIGTNTGILLNLSKMLPPDRARADVLTCLLQVVKKPPRYLDHVTSKKITYNIHLVV